MSVGAGVLEGIPGLVAVGMPGEVGVGAPGEVGEGTPGEVGVGVSVFEGAVVKVGSPGRRVRVEVGTNVG